jgi:thioredoxin-dependent peroxiredoxin
MPVDTIPVEEGQQAPDFTLMNDAGEEVTLSSFRGKPVVLYFYPKDNTSGCTTQACGIRDAWSEFERAGAVVLGVSPDGVTSHEQFKRDFELPFMLLADPDHTVAERYGAWGEKSNYGRTYEGILRSTFVIGRDGNVLRVIRNVKPAAHADQVLAILAASAG